MRPVSVFRGSQNEEIERSLCRRTSLRNQKPSTRNTYPLLSLRLAGVSPKAQSIPASADRTHFERFDLADQFVFFEARLKLWRESARFKQPNRLALTTPTFLDPHQPSHFCNYKPFSTSQIRAVCNLCKT